METEYDLIVIGGGVLGTFHAYHAMQRGLKVALIEKNSTPQGATVRNFGQIVPSGMKSKWQAYGRESLRIYNEIQAQFDISVRREGSIYFASNDAEVQLLEELNSINRSNDYSSKLWTRSKCLERYPGLRKDYVRAGLFFDQEIMVEPRVMINRLQTFLRASGLHLFSNTTVIECNALTNGVDVLSANNRSLFGAKALICNGCDFKLLYPQLFEESDLIVSKLQMMQTRPQPAYMLPGSVLTGLSIRRYEAFTECPSHTDLKSLEVLDSLEKKWGIHILFKQAMDGTVIIGDSHEYADAANSDELGTSLNMEIDNFIIQEAKNIIDLPTYEIQSRWYGLYSQCKYSDIYQHTLDDNIHIVTGIGGKGMTGSAGFAKENISKIFNIKYA